MKNRFICLLALVVCIFALTSCGEVIDEVETADDVAVVDNVETETANETEAINETETTDEADEAGEVAPVEYIRITPQEALEMMERENVVVLDVRSLEEFEQGHIPGAVLLPDTDVRENASSVIPDKTQIILVYCRSGRRSEGAARVLIELGYTRVYDFGGIADWVGEIVT